MEDIEITEGLRLENQEEEETTEELQEEQATEEETSTPEEAEAPAEEETSEEVTATEGEEGEVAEGEQEETEVEVNEHGKPFYSDEEVLALIQKGEDGKYASDFDTSRIKPGSPIEAVYKRMQAQFTPQLQERSELQKQVEALTQQFETYQQAQTQQTQKGSGPNGEWTWRDEFNQNPLGAMKRLDSEILKARSEDPYGEAVIQLQNVKDELTTEYLTSQTQERHKETVVNHVFNEIGRTVPGYFEKVEEYNQFAEEKLGFTRDEIIALTDVDFWIAQGSPTMPVKIASAIANWVEQARPKTAEAVIQQKSVKSTPTKVEKPGSGHEQQDKPEPTREEEVESLSDGRLVS